MILSLALCGCSGEEENPSDDEESSNMENIRPSITLVDDQNSDKVMTEKPFETPEMCIRDRMASATWPLWCRVDSWNHSS